MPSSKSASPSTRTASVRRSGALRSDRSADRGVPPERRILGVFAHPDDETSGAGGTITKYVRQGADVTIATATRGEMGALGAGGLVISREELPRVRERELRAVLRLYGARPPVLLGYRDQEVKDARLEEIVEKVRGIMRRVQPDVVITFGPRGISRHEDHIAVHRAAVEAFHGHRRSVPEAPRLFYVAIPKDMAQRFELDLDGPEVNPHVMVDISETVAVKVRALRTYRSQQDAQELAELFEKRAPPFESFHQAWPPIPNGRIRPGFWD